MGKNLKMVICIFLFLLYFQQQVDCSRYPLFNRLSLRRANASGGEALAFNARGGGPYTGVADGRILRYRGHFLGWQDFATTSPMRNEKACDSTNGSNAAMCGRVLGLGFDFLSGDLYAVDTHFGFQVIPQSGGLGIQLATGFNGANFTYPNALDIDQVAREVYFTDAGKVFQTGNLAEIRRGRDNDGKVYRYNIETAKLTLLISNMSGPTGLAVSRDGRYLVISEYSRSRIRRFWLKGPNALTSETLIRLSGNPENIKTTARGDFWVAVTVPQPPPVQTTAAIAIRFNGLGRVLETINLTSEYSGDLISEVQEYFRRLYIASTASSFVGVSRVRP
ncbi:OLC1v1014009C1 [Oldenlandia corymbosa var. corymbosa]|uniref:OLC1v1014009C1 n=1 Tax=Oldenlandia corymbosa var. corymbosa TaxID=529605 RepID=A0AAV1E030_OLDCO|nr:OLC1v1014009C1 [Oldenlandia corymbosa var. corymbosa]